MANNDWNVTANNVEVSGGMTEENARVRFAQWIDQMRAHKCTEFRIRLKHGGKIVEEVTE